MIEQSEQYANDLKQGTSRWLNLPNGRTYWLTWVDREGRKVSGSFALGEDHSPKEIRAKKQVGENSYSS